MSILNLFLASFQRRLKIRATVRSDTIPSSGDWGPRFRGSALFAKESRALPEDGIMIFFVPKSSVDDEPISATGISHKKR